MMKRIVVLLGMMLVSVTFATISAPEIDDKLALAYDGSDVETVWDSVGGVWRVTSLNDQAGASYDYDALAPTEARRPILAQVDTGNGIHPVIDFDGSNDYLLTSAFSTPMQQNNMVFIVAARDTVSSSYLIDGISTSSPHKVATISSGRYIVGAGKDVISGSYAGSGAFEIFTILFQSGSGGNSRMFVTDANGSTQVLLGDVGTSALTGLTIGRWAGGGGYLNGQIAELLVYDGAMSTAQMESVQQYLLDKYLVIPEPATMCMLGLGSLFVTLRKHRK